MKHGPGARLVTQPADKKRVTRYAEELTATASGGKIRTAIRASDITFLIIIISSLARR